MGNEIKHGEYIENPKCEICNKELSHEWLDGDYTLLLCSSEDCMNKSIKEHEEKLNIDNKIVLDLETLKYIDYIFKLHSDNSCRTNGYRSLCDLIEKEEKNTHILNKEDIEELGWEEFGVGWYKLKDVPGKLGYWTSVSLRKWVNNEIVIRGWRGNIEESNENDILFDGNIKNYNELKTLMEWLKIK